MSLTPLRRRLQRQTPPVFSKKNACWGYQMRRIFFPEPPLFDSGLTPQWRAGSGAVFTPPLHRTPREPSYLHNPASCGLHSKHSPPAAAKLKAGLMIREEKGLCVEAACFKNAATEVLSLLHLKKNPERRVFGNFSRRVSSFSLPASCFAIAIIKCKQAEQINIRACIQYPCSALCCRMLGIFISLFPPPLAESALCVLVLNPSLDHVRCAQRGIWRNVMRLLSEPRNII